MFPHPNEGVRAYASEVDPSLQNQSCRNATIGLILEARNAGTEHATMATNRRSTGVAKKMAGSSALIICSDDEINRRVA